MPYDRMDHNVLIETMEALKSRHEKTPFRYNLEFSFDEFEQLKDEGLIWENEDGEYQLAQFPISCHIAVTLPEMEDELYARIP